MTIWQTMFVGIGGSFIAGLLVRIIFGAHYTAGFLASLVCATGIVYAVRRHRGGSLTIPAARRCGAECGQSRYRKLAHNGRGRLTGPPATCGAPGT